MKHPPGRHSRAGSCLLQTLLFLALAAAGLTCLFLGSRWESTLLDWVGYTLLVASVLAPGGRRLLRLVDLLPDLGP